PPPSELVFSGTADVRLGGEVRRIVALGPSALAAHDGYLYVGYRTSSTVFRFALENDGSLVEPKIGELIAVFEPWSPEENRSANLIDLTFDSKGRLFVSCAQEGRIWNVGVPDPESVFDGVDHAQEPTWNRPYVDLKQLTSNPRARVGNIAFDEEDRLYVCSGNYDSGTALAGVIYRAVFER
ncbi:MAG: hypothetical protein O7B99_08315, partial [Planctomycetota bacterium]|nr:hypothetical protein [Planctomycetota bacterium]